MIWYDMIWYDMTWHDMTWQDMIWYMIWYVIIPEKDFSQSQARLLSWFFTKSRQCHDFRRNHRQFGFSLESQLQIYNWITVLLHRKWKRGENEATQALITKFPPKLIFWRSTVSQARETGVCARSRMNEVSQVEVILFSKYIFRSGMINM